MPEHDWTSGQENVSGSNDSQQMRVRAPPPGDLRHVDDQRRRAQPAALR